MNRKNAAEPSCRDETGEYPPIEASETVRKVLDHISRSDPELEQVINEHVHGETHHTAAAWSTESATLSFDRDGAAVEVMNQGSAAFRLFEAARDALESGTGQDDRREAAHGLVHMMTMPHRNGLGELPAELNALRERIEENLENMTDTAAQQLLREIDARSHTGEKFCDTTEAFASISRDLQHALEPGQPGDYDTALRRRNPVLWEQLRYGGDHAPDIFPLDGMRNPNATELLEVHRETAPGWSWRHGDAVRREIIGGTTRWLASDLQDREYVHRGLGRDEEARNARWLGGLVQDEAAAMGAALRDIARGRDADRQTERFHDALAAISEIALNPEDVLMRQG